MKTSEQIDKLAGALAKAQAAIKAPSKNKVAKVQTKTGGEYSYRYADLSDIIDAIRDPLASNGLAVTSGTEHNGHFTLNSRLIHESGQWIEASYPLPDGSIRAQEMGSAITYGRRYTLCALLGIVAEDDDDGEAAPATPPKKTATKAAPKAEKPSAAPTVPTPKADGNLWIGAIVKVESPRNGVWKVTGGDAAATEFGTATPEHAAVAKTALDMKSRVSVKFATQTTNNVKRILTIEPIVEEQSNG